MLTIGDVAALKSLGGPIGRWWRRRFGKPYLSLQLARGAPFEITEPAEAEGHALRFFRVRVANNGPQDFVCLAKLEQMVRSDRKPFKNAFLPVGLKTQHQHLQQRDGGRFNLRVGESKFIEVACLDERDPNSEIALRYESNAYPNTVPRADYSVVLSVYGGGRPASRRYRLYVDARGYLKFVEEPRYA